MGWALQCDRSWFTIQPLRSTSLDRMNKPLDFALIVLFLLKLPEMFDSGLVGWYIGKLVNAVTQAGV